MAVVPLTASEACKLSHLGPHGANSAVESLEWMNCLVLRQTLSVDKICSALICGERTSPHWRDFLWAELLHCQTRRALFERSNTTAEEREANQRLSPLCPHTRLATRSSYEPKCILR